MGEKLVKALHSRYNPQREAERFVDSLLLPTHTRYIIIAEPGESYLASVLRDRFPAAKLIALRFGSTMFLESDGLWNAVWRPALCGPLESFLLNCIPDEFLNATRYAEWPPAGDSWPEAARSVRDGVRAFLEIQKKVMLTRGFFGPRWLKNMVDNLAGIRNFASVSSGTAPVFLAGAGPSLDIHADLARDAPFSLAVSSALMLFRDRNITPDLCVATDGGYWAKRYFQNLPETCMAAISLEAALPVQVAENHMILPLSYGSALEAALFGCAGIASVPAKRNGTVSGTAAELALSLTTGPVYASGLDFQSSVSYHHGRPHFSEEEIRNRSYRLNPAASSFFPKQDHALDVYAQWFEANAERFSSRFSRLLPAGRNLTGIRETDPGIAREAFKTEGIAPRLQPQGNIPGRAERIQSLIRYLESIAQRMEGRSRADCVPSVTGEGDLSDFLQLANYRLFMENAPLLDEAAHNRETGLKIAEWYTSMANTARSLIERIENRGK